MIICFFISSNLGNLLFLKTYRKKQLDNYGKVRKNLIITGASELSIRTLRATIPENESQPNFLILI